MAKKEVEQESENFRIAFSGGGTDHSADCEYCGRTYFCDPSATGNYCYEEGEYEELKNKAEMNLMYVEVDSISYTHACGKQYIWGCSCRALRKYEDFLLDKRSQILSFYRAELRDEEEQAKRNKEDFKPFEKEE